MKFLATLGLFVSVSASALPVIDITNSNTSVNYDINFSDDSGFLFEERGDLRRDIGASTNTTYSLPGLAEPLRLLTDSQVNASGTRITLRALTYSVLDTGSTLDVDANLLSAVSEAEASYTFNVTGENALLSYSLENAAGQNRAGEFSLFDITEDRFIVQDSATSIFSAEFIDLIDGHSYRVEGSVSAGSISDEYALLFMDFSPGVVNVPAPSLAFACVFLLMLVPR